MKVYFSLQLFVGGAGYSQEDNKDEGTHRVTSQKAISRGSTCLPPPPLCLFIFTSKEPPSRISIPLRKKDYVQFCSSFTCTRKKQLFKPEGFPVRCPEAYG